MRRTRVDLIPGGMTEITIGTVNREKLLHPQQAVTEAILGVIGSAQAKHPEVRIHAFVFLSTHYHMLITSPSPQLTSDFEKYVNGNIARIINFIGGRSGHLWGRRYDGIPVSHDAGVQIARLRYILAHGVKERLVTRVDDWPGASSTQWLRYGEEMRGIWTNYTAKHAYERRRKGAAPKEIYETVYPIRFSPLPCWRDLPEAEWRALVEAMVVEIEADARAECEELGREPMGVEAILASDPSEALAPRERSPAPLAHAGREELKALRAIRRAVTAWYRVCSERFRSGKRNTKFPPQTFRPNGGFAGERVPAAGAASAALVAAEVWADAHLDRGWRGERGGRGPDIAAVVAALAAPLDSGPMAMAAA